MGPTKIIYTENTLPQVLSLNTYWRYHINTTTPTVIIAITTMAAIVTPITIPTVLSSSSEEEVVLSIAM